MKNYYEILEVNKKASKEIINKAYRVLIKKYHPDLYKGEARKYAEKKTKEINEAYDVLSNEFLKEQYDEELEKMAIEDIKNTYKNSQKSEYKEESIEKKQGNKPKIGTFQSIIYLTKDLISLLKNKEKRDEIKQVTKKDVVAIILTIVIVILIGVILWFIPLTNGWMRELLFENALFNWIGSLFS